MVINVPGAIHNGAILEMFMVGLDRLDMNYGFYCSTCRLSLFMVCSGAHSNTIRFLLVLHALHGGFWCFITATLSGFCSCCTVECGAELAKSLKFPFLAFSLQFKFLKPSNYMFISGTPDNILCQDKEWMLNIATNKIALPVENVADLGNARYIEPSSAGNWSDLISTGLLRTRAPEHAISSPEYASSNFKRPSKHTIASYQLLLQWNRKDERANPVRYIGILEIRLQLLSMLEF